MEKKVEECHNYIKSVFKNESTPLLDMISGDTRHYVISYLASNGLLPRGFFDRPSIAPSAAELLQGHTVSKVYEYLKKGYISQERVSSIKSPIAFLNEYYSTKQTKFLRLIPPCDLIEFYLLKLLEFKELPNTISSGDILKAIENKNISPSNVITLAQDENFEKIFPRSNKLLELYNKFALGGKTMLELITLGKINPEAIPNLYAKEQVLQNAIIVPEAFGEKYLTTDDDFRQLFSIDFMLRLENKGKFTPELVEFYKSTIVPSCEDEKEEFYSKRRENLKKLELTNNNIPTLLSLAEKGILSIDDISALDIKESDLTLAGLSCEKLCILYSAGKIDGINLLDMSPTELITCWKKGALTENALNDFLVPTDFANAYSERNIECKDMLHLFNADKIDIENLDCLEQSELQETILQMHILSNDKAKGAPIEDRFISPEKIADLFLNKRIDFDTFKKLHSDGKISQEDYIEATDKYDVEGALEQIKKLVVIQNTAESDGQIVPSNPLPLSGPTSTPRKVSIDPELRNDFLTTLGSEYTLPIIDGALKGYMFITIPGLKTVVLEKLYNTNLKTGAITPALDNATFVLPLIKGLELAQNSNKTDLRSEDNVYPVNHTKGWAKNLLEKIGKVNPKFEYKRYQKEHSDLIKSISENYKGNKGNRGE